MDFRQQHTSQPLFSHYTTHSVTLGEREYQGPISILPGASGNYQAEAKEGTLTLIEWTIELIPRLMAAQAEVVLIGTGQRLLFPSVAQRERLYASGLVNMEWMDTPAACRTYNVLIGEGRKVAGLFWLDDGKGSGT